MDRIIETLALLAQVAPSRRLAASFRNSGWDPTWSDVWPWLLLAAIAAGAYGAYRYRRQRNDMTQTTDDPWKLFRELCLVHELDAPSQKLLKQLTSACGFAQPAQVFLTPQALGGELTPEALRPRSNELAALRQRLF